MPGGVCSWSAPDLGVPFVGAEDVHFVGGHVAGGGLVRGTLNVAGACDDRIGRLTVLGKRRGGF